MFSSTSFGVLLRVPIMGAAFTLLARFFSFSSRASVLFFSYCESPFFLRHGLPYKRRDVFWFTWILVFSCFESTCVVVWGIISSDSFNFPCHWVDDNLTCRHLLTRWLVDTIPQVDGFFWEYSCNHFMEFDAFLKIFDWRINLQVFFMDVPGVIILNACGPEWIIACTTVGEGTDALVANDLDVDFAICILRNSNHLLWYMADALDGWAGCPASMSLIVRLTGPGSRAGWASLYSTWQYSFGMYPVFSPTAGAVLDEEAPRVLATRSRLDWRRSMSK